MKSVIISFVLLVIGLHVASAQNNQAKKDPVGVWKFDAPYAPAGYTSGTVDVSFTDNKYAVIMRFSSDDTNYKGGKVKFENGTISFSIYVEDQYVAVTMKMETTKEMTGKAVYSEGEVQIIMVKDVSGK